MDHMFLQIERGNQYIHVAGLGIYDPSRRRGARCASRTYCGSSRPHPSVPAFRRRLVTVPLSLDRPYWVEDPSSTSSFTSVTSRCPNRVTGASCASRSPGCTRDRSIAAALWEVYVIEGLHNIRDRAPGSFALYVKLHHSLFDGEAAAGDHGALHSLTPMRPRSRTGRCKCAMRIATRHPGNLFAGARQRADRGTKTGPLHAWHRRTLAALGARSAAENRSKLRAGVGSLLKGDLASLLPKAPPATRFSNPVSAHRVFEAVGLPMADIRTIRQQVPNATVNDVFMAVVGGALRRYLSAKGELPEASMVAGVPMTLRGADKSGDGNRISFTAMAVHSDIADPVARLEATAAVGRKVQAPDRRAGQRPHDEHARSLPPPCPRCFCAASSCRSSASSSPTSADRTCRCTWPVREWSLIFPSASCWTA